MSATVVWSANIFIFYTFVSWMGSSYISGGAGVERNRQTEEALRANNLHNHNHDVCRDSQSIQYQD